MFLVGMSWLLVSCGVLERVPYINKAGALGEMTLKVFSRDDEVEIMSPVRPARAANGSLPDVFAEGDRIAMSVYEGVRKARRIARVDEVLEGSGKIDFKHVGSIEVAGSTPQEVESAVSSAALRSEKGLGVHFTTHLESWNGNPVVEVRGRVVSPRLLLMGSSDMSPASAIAMVGGFTGPETVSRVLLVRNGKQRPILVASRDFDSLELKAGDRLLVE